MGNQSAEQNLLIYHTADGAIAKKKLGREAP